MRVTIEINKPINLYSFGISTKSNPSDVTFLESNIFNNITTSGLYYVFIKNKSTNTIEFTKQVFIKCLDGVVTCDINIIPAFTVSKCFITIKPVLVLNSNPVICDVNIKEPKVVGICNIRNLPINIV